MKISDVPMLTADECEIEINGILYSYYYERGSYWTGTCDFKIEAHRVISINASSRFFRTRCVGGCETEYSYLRGCPRQKLYGKFESVVKEIKLEISHDLSKALEFREKIYDTEKSIIEKNSKLQKATPAKIKKPKPVEV